MDTFSKAALGITLLIVLTPAIGWIDIALVNYVFSTDIDPTFRRCAAAGSLSMVVRGTR